jgi:pSer/pThr/pTyr-binding forkhead associated (FHA) protein
MTQSVSEQASHSGEPAVLLVKSGFYEGLEVPLEGAQTVIGRGRGADIVLAEPTISREHAVIGRSSEGWYVEDLGSTNGSYANGGRITRHPLKPGDEIVLGRLSIEVTLPGDI